MKRPLALFLLLATAPSCQMRETPSFLWLRDVELPEIAAATPVAVPLDSHVFEFTRSGLPDLRLRNAPGEAVGFVIRPASEQKPHTIRTTWPAQQSSAQVDANEGLQIDLKLKDDDPAPDGIRIITPLRNFEHQVRVEASVDGFDWVSAGPPVMIFDYSSYVDARNDFVPFTPGEHRRFRIIIGDLTAEQESELLELHRRLQGGQEVGRDERFVIDRRPFRVDRIEFYRDEEQVEPGKLQTTEYPVAGFEAAENEKKQQTIVTIRTRTEPVTGITIETPAENFSRAATIEAEIEDASGLKSWRKIASGTLTRFAVGAIRREETRLAIPEVDASAFRVVIENRDSPPLPISEVELSGPLYRLLYLATPGQAVSLEYGSATASAGHYDTAALQSALSHGQPVAIAALAPPAENPNAPGIGRPWMPWNDLRVLAGTILGLTLLLGWGLYHASRRINRPPGT